MNYTFLETSLNIINNFVTSFEFLENISEIGSEAIFQKYWLQI